MEARAKELAKKSRFPGEQLLQDLPTFSGDDAQFSELCMEVDIIFKFVTGKQHRDTDAAQEARKVELAHMFGKRSRS